MCADQSESTLATVRKRSSQLFGAPCSIHNNVGSLNAVHDQKVYRAVFSATPEARIKYNEMLSFYCLQNGLVRDRPESKLTKKITGTAEILSPYC